MIDESWEQVNSAKWWVTVYTVGENDTSSGGYLNAWVQVGDLIIYDKSPLM